MANLLNNDVYLATYFDRIRRACDGNVFRTMVRHEGNTIAIGVKGAQHPGLARPLCARRSHYGVDGARPVHVRQENGTPSPGGPGFGIPSIRQAGLRTGHLTTAETMAMEHLLVIHYVLLVVAGWLVVAVLGLASLHRTRVVAHGLFPVGAVFGLLLCGLGLTGVFAGPQEADPAARPARPAVPPAARRAVGVLPAAARRASRRRLALRRRLFPQGRRHAARAALPRVPRLPRQHGAACCSPTTRTAFMVAWETMALSSFFLVTTNHRIAEIRRAGFLYLLIAHVGAIAHPAVLRRAAGQHRRLHLRQHARSSI